MNILIVEASHGEGKYFQEHLKGHQVITSHDPLSGEHRMLLATVEVLSVFIYSKVDKRMLDMMPKLKMIVTRSTGADHIDEVLCRKRGIKLYALPKYGSVTVAEHTIALLLALSRNIVPSVEKTRHDDFSLDGLHPFELQGKMLGVIGTGNIGAKVIEVARALGMIVVAYDPVPNNDLASKVGFAYLPYTTVLGVADILSFHLPLTKSTFHMFDKKALKLVKKGVHIINTARGAIIDTEALIEGLDKKIIAGAALDVLEGEGELKDMHQSLKKGHLDAHNWKLLRKNHALLKNHNVIITAHTAFYSKESIERVLESTLYIIKSFIVEKEVYKKQDGPIR